MHLGPLPSCCVLRFLMALQRKMCGKKQWRFPNIRGLFHLYMNRLKNQGLKVSEIPVSYNSPYYPPPPYLPSSSSHFLLRFSMFHIVFLLFFQTFPIFPVVFMHVSYFRSYDLFFRKEIYFFECFFFSQYDISMSLYVFWLRKEPSIKYVHNCWGIQSGYNCAHSGVGEGAHASCVRTSLQQHFCLILSRFICRNLT